MKNSGNIEPEVLYYASSLTGNLWVPPDLDGNETVLKGFAPTVAGATAYVHPEIWRRLSKSRADLTVVADYSAPTAQLAMAFLRSNKKPWVFWERYRASLIVEGLGAGCVTDFRWRCA